MACQKNFYNFSLHFLCFELLLKTICHLAEIVPDQMLMDQLFNSLTHGE
ncbi:Uncharacterized protein dnm_084010 [Desulfonema magnum]|uniref:Uncharacterized protein n=1 Tax=Desulfonema magnum TaxID=45655 RepID=A0A975GTN5_9BACT|nr:Uncharacterized protein dnm_084010 [Desulfonema magnum]